MNWDQVKGNWKQFRGRAQQRWGQLTDDDLDQIKGERKRLEGVLQERYGTAREDVEREVDEWMESDLTGSGTRG